MHVENCCKNDRLEEILAISKFCKEFLNGQSYFKMFWWD